MARILWPKDVVTVRNAITFRLYAKPRPENQCRRSPGNAIRLRQHIDSRADHPRCARRRLWVSLHTHDTRPWHTTCRNAPYLSDAQLATFADTMCGWFTQLRQLGPPPSESAVCGFMGTPFQSFRIQHDEYVGPFESLAEFHSQRYCSLPPSADPPMRELDARIRQKPYRICFTHGDLSPNNSCRQQLHARRPCGLGLRGMDA